MEAARAAYARAGVRLRTDVTAGLPDVRVDQDRIQEVFTNLLDNALRHTAAPGAVTLTGRRSGAGAVELAVADTGDGLAPSTSDASSSASTAPTPAAPASTAAAASA